MDGDPKPNVTWMRDYMPVDIAHRFTIIDQGNYCVCNLSVSMTTLIILKLIIRHIKHIYYIRFHTFLNITNLEAQISWWGLNKGKDKDKDTLYFTSVV